jgi:uncharacterized protein YbjT (DUF2867 family)
MAGSQRSLDYFDSSPTGCPENDDFHIDLLVEYHPNRALCSPYFTNLPGLIKTIVVIIIRLDGGVDLPQPVLVIGALGNVGSAVVQALSQQDVPIRAADLDPAAIQKRFGNDMEAVRFDFYSPESVDPVVRGIKQMFLMRPPQITDVKRLMFPLIDAAVTAGVEHVVFLSIIGIEHNRRVPHYQVEQRLRTSGMKWTFLRASFFMQNLNTTHRAEIRDRDEIFVPVGKGKTSFIDVRDLGAVAALALTQPGHENQAYDLTGPEALDYYQVADLFSQVLGRPITYRNPSLVNFVSRSLRHGTPLPFALVMAWLYHQTRNGLSEQVTGEVERLLGRPPTSLRRYIEDYQDAWSPGEK